MDLIFDGAMPPPHHPRWKARVPRDSGAGWDFEDVRDHYLRELCGLDPIALRSADLERYFALSRAVTGEVMKQAFAEWRRPGSGCGGALVWFLKDLLPGAGWGLLDSEGRPKSAYWHLRRAWARQAVLVTDEGLEGLRFHVFNETAAGLDAILELELLQGGRIPVGKASRALSLPPFSSTTVSGDAMLSYFADLAYAYRFGPPKHEVALVSLRAPSGSLLSQDTHLPMGLVLPQLERPQVSAAAAFLSSGEVEATLASDAFLHGVVLTAPGFLPDDNHFHLGPDREKRLRFRPVAGNPGRFKAHLSALNLRNPLTLRAEP
jgi:beta-mannosidase